MLTKRCRHCGQELELTTFYTHPKMKDGHLHVCKKCCNRRDRNYRLNPINRERIRAYARTQATGKRGRQASLRLQKRNPLRYKARYIITNAIRDGKLGRQPCDICGEVAQAHHDDNSKPLEVRWLCFRHHRELAHGQIVGPIPM